MHKKNLALIAWILGAVMFTMFLFNSLFFATGKERFIFLKEEKIRYNENDGNYLFYIPTSLKLDQKGNIYVVDSHNHRIQVFSNKGDFIRTIGRKGEGPSELFNPTDIFIKGDILYISDSGNRRIQVVDIKGNFRKTIRLDFSPVYILRLCYEVVLKLNFSYDKISGKIEIFGITRDDMESIKNFRERYRINFPLIYDKLAKYHKKFKVKVIPHRVLIKEKKIIYEDDPYKDISERDKEFNKILKTIL